VGICQEVPRTIGNLLVFSTGDGAEVSSINRNCVKFPLNLCQTSGEPGISRITRTIQMWWAARVSIRAPWD